MDERLKMNEPCKNPGCGCDQRLPLNLGSKTLLYWCPQCGSLNSSAFEDGVLIPTGIFSDRE